MSANGGAAALAVPLDEETIELDAAMILGPTPADFIRSAAEPAAEVPAPETQTPEAQTRETQKPEARKPEPAAPAADGKPLPRDAGAAPEGPLSEADRRLADACLALNLVTEDQLAVAERDKRAAPYRPLGEIFVERGFLSNTSLGGVLGELISETDGDRHPLIDPSAVRLLPRDVARVHQALAVSSASGTVILAVARACDVATIPELRPYFPTGARIEPRLWPAPVFENALDAFYNRDMTADAALKDIVARGPSESGQGWDDPIQRLANALVLDGVRLGAAAIHFDPELRFVRIAFRVDGAVTPVATLPKAEWPALAARFRGLARRAHGAETMRFRFGDRRIDGVLNAIDTLQGENLVIRLVERAKPAIAMDRLGLSEPVLAQVRRAAARPQGLVIVAAPQGAGRTTTLFSFLENAARGASAASIECEHKVRINGVAQLHVAAPSDSAVADAIRAAQAQGRDTLLVAGLPGPSSAQAALEAANAGARVFAGLVAPDSASALAKLMEWAAAPSQLTGTLTAVMSQRLARKLCAVCKESRPATAAEARLMGAPVSRPPVLRVAGGCPYCRGSGHKGRVLVSEVLLVDDELEDVIAGGATRAEIMGLARDKGFVPMQADGLARVKAGDLSLEELARVVDLTRPV